MATETYTSPRSDPAKLDDDRAIQGDFANGGHARPVPKTCLSAGLNRHDIDESLPVEFRLGASAVDSFTSLRLECRHRVANKFLLN